MEQKQNFTLIQQRQTSQSPNVMMVQGFSVQFKGAASLFPAAGQVQPARFPVMCRVRLDVVLAAVTVPVHGQVVAIVSMVDVDLTYTVAVGVCHHRWI